MKLSEDYWIQIGGDMSPELYDGIFARLDGEAVELLHIHPTTEYGVEEFPFYVSIGRYDPDDLAWSGGTAEAAEFSDLTKDQWDIMLLEHRALALFEYGIGRESWPEHNGWAKDVLPDEPIYPMYLPGDPNREPSLDDDVRLRLDYFEADDMFMQEVLGKIELYKCGNVMATGRRAAAEWDVENACGYSKTVTDAETSRAWAIGHTSLSKLWLTLQHDDLNVLLETADYLVTTYNNGKGRYRSSDFEDEVDNSGWEFVKKTLIADGERAQFVMQVLLPESFDKTGHHLRFGWKDVEGPGEKRNDPSTAYIYDTQSEAHKMLDIYCPDTDPEDLRVIEVINV